MRGLGTLHGPSSSAAAADLRQIASTSFIEHYIQNAFLYTDGILQDIGSLGDALTERRVLNEAGNCDGTVDLCR